MIGVGGRNPPNFMDTFVVMEVATKDDDGTFHGCFRHPGVDPITWHVDITQLGAARLGADQPEAETQRFDV
jgi:hypothetical protein